MSRASSLDQALSLKAEYGDEARFLAGGQSLIPAMNFRLARPSVLIDINGLGELAGVSRSEGKGIRVGALTRYRALERNGDFLKACPLFADALPHIAHPQIRNRGTIGGNLSHADPASELPAVATAMGARMRIKSTAKRAGSRRGRFLRRAAHDGYRGRRNAGGGFVSRRRSRAREAASWKWRAGAAILRSPASPPSSRWTRKGDCSELRLALCGVGETPVDASHAAASLIGQRLTDKAIEAVAAEVQSMIAPSGNVHASPDYQRHIAGVLVSRAIRAAQQRVGHAA